MKNLKSEKGAITLFVLLALLFFMVIVTGLFFRTSNNIIIQDGDIRAIEKEYTVTNDELQDKYNEMK